MSEVGKQFDYLYLEGARGISDPSMVDANNPDEASQAAAQKGYAASLHSNKLLQAVLDGGAVQNYVRGQHALFEAEEANSDVDDVCESGGQKRGSDKVVGTLMYVEDLAQASRPSNFV